ncbi:hypothetical protein CHLRE_06g297049v5 [Chlamydomonas reinhardtii]|uniref:Uncharacterized protein n=1 Tax=Chlamydomonas reinhardtii TaxID=3055 RepID=A0A2K3DQN4_CHLRE|nr:uncharacterized protein CHLRE_06g297049v5 [Chlamydomonas reinhardtii]PNW82852.1 hypothetical protein CHLRE_06g297049v5 [Chlamydomonas reinhardtii]
MVEWLVFGCAMLIGGLLWLSYRQGVSFMVAPELIATPPASVIITMRHSERAPLLGQHQASRAAAT